MEQIRIVNYRPELAAAVADMWNKSRDGWGGGTSVTTEEQVRQQEANSDNINLFIAMDGEAVVGYCGLSEYREDEGALYIPLLNVRGDYQGKKIGKLLLLKAIEKSIELGWPRLDLYTWPGNTKAVPLYKKCGFFWEQRDDTTHLMNFIPSALSTDATKDFFSGADWYQDAMRVIEVKPDGRKENGFDFFEYVWEKNNKKLRMEFERRGRGLRLIETDDYMISATVDKSELVFGKEYAIRYDILNKSGSPLEVSLTGQDDKNISFSYEQKANVKDEVVLHATFLVNEIEEEISVWRTHPTVSTTLLINGKEARFKLGIVPKLPANVSAKEPSQESFIGVPSQFYLDIENNFNEEVEFQLKLPKVPFIHLEKDELTLAMKPKEKKSIVIQYVLQKFGFYQAKIAISAQLSNGDQISYTKRIGLAFKGIGASFSGECDEYWHIYNGHYEVLLRKLNNTIIPGRSYMNEQPSYLMPPKLGKPYSNEFTKKRPERVECFEEKGAMVLKATYQPNHFSQLQLISVTKLYAEGLIEHFYEIKNLSTSESSSEIWVNQPVVHDLYRSVFPYDGQIIELKDTTGIEYGDWDSSRVTENWLFAKGRKIPRGICWSPKYKINFENWYLFFEYPIGALAAQECVKTEATTISIGAFQEWEDFRGFALKTPTPASAVVTQHVELTVNNHNPIVKDQCTLTLKDYKSSYFDGDVEVSLLGADKLLTKSFTPDEEEREAHLEITLNPNQPIDILSIQTKFVAQQQKLQTLLLQQGANEIKFEQREEEGVTSFCVDNGSVQIKAAPDFYPSLSSLIYKGNEWLDSSFPKPQAKSWWNPWGGGIGYSMKGISNNSLLKEKSHAEFTSLIDNYHNEWKGIKLETSLREHEQYKGLQWNQYFVLLPGLPIVCATTEIVQETGKFLSLAEWYSDAFLQLRGNKQKSWIKTFNRHGEQVVYPIGKGEVECRADSSLLCESEGSKDILQVITDLSTSRLHFYSNNEITVITNWRKLNLKDGARLFTAPVFYLLTDQVIPEGALHDLKKIRF
jgi:ribosomal protein S18 acetylase RimI-like enzyme